MESEKGDLRDLDLPPEIETDTTDFIQEFYNPTLSRAVEYKRGVGYFTSSWMEYAAEGISELAKNGGKAKWITSPILEEKDWEAFEVGEEAKQDETLYQSLEKTVDDLEEGLKKDTLNTISWMIADGLLEIKFAVPQGGLHGDFHDKWGIIQDKNGNRVAFHGSQNDSKKATENYESYDIFCDWLGEREEQRVDKHEGRFDKLWKNEKANLKTYSLPEGVRDQIVEKRERDDRPYPEPDDTQHNEKKMKMPDWVEARDYQDEAVKEWMRDNGQGILKMATGTGKTLTSLIAATRLSELQEDKLSLVVAVPYQHLVEQWRGDVEEFGLNPVLAYGSRSNWENRLSRFITEYKTGSRDYVTVITTHKTFSSSHFQAMVGKMNGAETLLIGDEVHHMGASGISESLPEHIRARLGLSATPERHYDDEGTEKLKEYFGGGVSYEYGIEEAIERGSLCEYYYVPHIIELTEEEAVEYEKLSKKIAKLFQYSDGDLSDFDLEENQNLQTQLFKRARLVGTAENKLIRLKELLSEEESVEHTLVYCGDGSVEAEESNETKRQVEAAVEMLGNELGLLVHPFTAKESDKKRQELLQDFESGDLQALVAIRCLDEGVDVPATRTAYILASSSNPRQIVQRRGRILRNHPGKDHAVIHDFVVRPPKSISLSGDADRFNTERKLVKKELERVETFAEAAKNYPDVVPDWIPSSEGSIDDLRNEFNLQTI